MSLKAENITFSYEKDGKEILQHVNLEIHPKERVGIAAPSGYGKTTLMKILSGYLTPQTGQILVEGKKLEQNGYCNVQMIWQHPELTVNPKLKMKDVLTDCKVSDYIIDQLGIKAQWMERYPSQLSGGELQRFCIARALCENTKYLVADEITTMVDAISQNIIWQFLIRETREREIGLIVSSHSETLLNKICTRKIDMDSL